MKKQIIAVSALALTSAVAQAADGSSFSGFVDAQWGWIKDGTTDGARVNLGQVAWTHQMGEASVKLEVPFAQTTGTSDFVLGNDLTQAFIQYSYASGLSWSLGQWDGIFGLERNDTNAVQFTNQGAMFGTQAKTNTGLLLGYKLSDSMNVDLYVSGARDAGGTDSMDAPELGGKFTLGGDFRLGVGAFFRQEGDDVNRLYVNTVVGMKMAGLDLGAEVTYTKAGAGDAAIGAGLIGSYGITDSTTAGVRVQYLSKFDAHQQIDVTVGPQFNMTKNLRVKADYTYSMVTATEGADSVNGQSAALAAVYSF